MHTSLHVFAQALPVFRAFRGGKQVGGDVVGYKKQALTAAVEALAKGA